MGQTFLYMDRLPTPKYCPKPYSMNNSGIPIKQIMIMYGMRKAPETKENRVLGTKNHIGNIIIIATEVFQCKSSGKICNWLTGRKNVFSP